MNRALPWLILAALTLARAIMALQFQSVAALAPEIAEATGMGFVAIGTLSGAYFLPGVGAALLGGWAGQRFGDVRVALGGLALMTLGGLAGAALLGFETQLAARLVAGVGAVAVNVMLNKMVGDWFQGRPDLPVAMSLLVASWPAGLAIATLGLPLLAGVISLSALSYLIAGLCLAAFLLVFFTWRPAPGVPTVPTARARMTGLEWRLIFLSGAIWGVYNLGFIGALSWTPPHLVEMGFDALDAAATASLMGWIAILSVASGGWLARALPRPDLLALGAFLLSAATLALLATGRDDLPVEALMLVLGCALGPAAGLVMTLPITATRTETRAAGLGVYWAIYYALMSVGPVMFGAVRDSWGLASAPLWLAALMMLLCLPLWGVFRFAQAKTPIPQPG
ncbi:MAG: MFS transporter [Pseudomonadota bacterium]